MATTTFAVRRSRECATALALQSATNVPDEYDVTVDIAHLSQSSREVLLTIGRGEYEPHYDGIRYDPETGDVTGSYFPSCCEELRLDLLEPTALDIDSAIDAALARIALSQHDRDAEREAAAALERRRAEAALLLDDKFAALKKQIATLQNTLEYRDTIIQDRDERIDTLSRFIAAVSPDSLDSAADAIVARDVADRRRELVMSVNDAMGPDYCLALDDLDEDD